MILGVSFSALPTMTTARALNPTIITGNRNSGTRTVEMRVRRSRTHSGNSLRETMPTARRVMALGLHLGLKRGDDFDEDFLEVLLGMFFAQLGEGAFGQKPAVVNDADDVAELFDFAHDVRGEDDGLAAVAAFTDEGGDGSGGHDVEAEGGLVENHHRGVVDQGAGDGSLLLHDGGKLVAAAVAEGVHIEAIENDVEAIFEGGFVETV